MHVSLGTSAENASNAYIGIFARQHTRVRPSFAADYGTTVAGVFAWVMGLFYWLFLLNLGIGLFNLLPIGPIDGGRMLRLVMHKWFTKEKGERIWRVVSLVFLFLVLANIMAGFVG